jgi:hypothetical protein
MLEFSISQDDMFFCLSTTLAISNVFLVLIFGNCVGAFVLQIINE